MGFEFTEYSIRPIRFDQRRQSSNVRVIDLGQKFTQILNLLREIKQKLKVIENIVDIYQKNDLINEISENLSELKYLLYIPNVYLVKISDQRFEYLVNTFQNILLKIDEIYNLVETSNFKHARIILTQLESEILKYLQLVTLLGVSTVKVEEIIPIHELVKKIGKIELPREAQELPEFHKQILALILSKGRVTLKELIQDYSPETQNMILNVVNELIKMGFIKSYVDTEGNVVYEPYSKSFK